MKTLILFMILLYFCIGNLFSQSIDCVEYEGPYDWPYSTEDINGEYFSHSVGLVKMIKNGRLEIAYGSIIQFNTFKETYGLNEIDAMKTFQYFFLLNNLYNDNTFNNYINCSQNSDTVYKEIAFLSMVPCTTYNLCRLRLHDVNYIECCTDGSYPSGITLEGSWYKDVKFETTCGWKCCETVYTIRCIPNISEGISKKEIVSIVTNDYAPRPCPSNPTGTNCVNSQTVPCSANCNN